MGKLRHGLHIPVDPKWSPEFHRGHLTSSPQARCCLLLRMAAGDFMSP